jgi:hypothetical protein
LNLKGEKETMSIFSKLSKLAVLKSADRVLESRNRVAEAIERETAKLLELVIERAGADRALVEAQAAVALGEQADDSAARRKAEQAAVAIDRQSATLTGLRNRLAGQAGEIEGQYRAVKNALPDHIERVRSEFTSEWGRGVAVFSALLSKRRALEGRIGKLDLAEPSPSDSELAADITAPWSALAELENSLEQIAGWSRAAIISAVDAMGGRIRAFDPEAIYTLTRQCDNLPAGTLVTAGVFAPGFLNHLVQIGYAVALEDQNWEQSLHAAHQAKLRQEAERQEEQLKAVAEPAYPPEVIEASRQAAAENRRHAQHALHEEGIDIRSRVTVEGSGPK